MKVRWPYFVRYAKHYDEVVLRVYHGFELIREWRGDSASVKFAYFLDGWLEARDWHAREEL